MNGAFDGGAFDDVAFDVGTILPIVYAPHHGQVRVKPVRYVILRDPDFDDEEIIAAWMALEEQ